MRRSLHILFFSFTAVLLLTCFLTSCHFVTSDNGDLDGLWQLRVIEDLSTGVVTDGRDDDVTWAFQGNLLSTRNKRTELLFRFNHAGNTLVLSNPYFSGRFTSLLNDTLITDVSQLADFKIYRLEEHFEILQLDGDNMCLQSDRVRMSFRKY